MRVERPLPKRAPVGQPAGLAPVEVAEELGGIEAVGAWSTVAAVAEARMAGVPGRLMGRVGLVPAGGMGVAVPRVRVGDGRMQPGALPHRPAAPAAISLRRVNFRTSSDYGITESRRRHA